MEIQITKKEHKPLLRRTDIEARISFTGTTPSKKEAVAAVAKAVEAKHELVIVRTVSSTYGGVTGKISARVYDDRATLEKLERPATIRKQNGHKKEEPKGDA